MSNTYPSKSEYEAALKTVKQYEERQATLQRLAKDLSFHLSKFDTVKFKVDKKKGKVLFTGVIDGKIKIGESQCASSDVFVDTIGKLVAVLKALNLSINEVVEHVERKNYLYSSVALESSPYKIDIGKAIDEHIAKFEAVKAVKW